MKPAYIPATQRDIPVIFSQAKALIDAYEDVSAIDYDRVLAWLEKKIAENISSYTCLVQDGKICAYYRLCDDGELDDLYVLPEFQGKGIGSHILRKCIDGSDTPLYLYVFSRNTRAIALYERFGFCICERVSNTRYIMRRNG